MDLSQDHEMWSQGTAALRPQSQRYRAQEITAISARYRLLLKCALSTIGKYVKEVEAEKGVQIPDRGKLHDMGRSVTHKKESVRYMLQNYSQTEITKLTHHSGEAVDRYLKDYNRVKILRDKLAPEEVAFATGLSIALVNEYLDLIKEMEGKGENGGETICQ